MSGEKMASRVAVSLLLVAGTPETLNPEPLPLRLREAVLLLVWSPLSPLSLSVRTSD